MVDIKRKVLLASAALIILITSVSLLNFIFVSDEQLKLLISHATSILTTCTVGLFFVGVALPRE